MGREQELRDRYGKLYGALSREERRVFNQGNRSYRKRYRRAYDRLPERVVKKAEYDHQRTLTRQYMRQHAPT